MKTFSRIGFALNCLATGKPGPCQTVFDTASGGELPAGGEPPPAPKGPPAPDHPPPVASGPEQYLSAEDAAKIASVVKDVAKKWKAPANLKTMTPTEVQGEMDKLYTPLTRRPLVELNSNLRDVSNLSVSIAAGVSPKRLNEMFDEMMSRPSGEFANSFNKAYEAGPAMKNFIKFDPAANKIYQSPVLSSFNNAVQQSAPMKKLTAAKAASEQRIVKEQEKVTTKAQKKVKRVNNSFVEAGKILLNCGGIGGTPGPCKTTTKTVEAYWAGVKYDDYVKDSSVTPFDKENLARMLKKLNKEIDGNAKNLSKDQLAELVAAGNVNKISSAMGEIYSPTSSDLVTPSSGDSKTGKGWTPGQTIKEYQDTIKPPSGKVGQAFMEEYGIGSKKQFVDEYTKAILVESNRSKALGQGAKSVVGFMHPLVSEFERNAYSSLKKSKYYSSLSWALTKADSVNRKAAAAKRKAETKVKK